MQVRIEEWMGHKIRFVEKSPGVWWAVAADVAEALNYSRTSNMLRKLKDNQKGTHLVSTPGGNQELSIISESGIYRAILRSRRSEAEDFEEWVYETISVLRKGSGLEGFQIFRMLDREHQREAMKKLGNVIQEPVRTDFIKANTIANKAVSTAYGHPKMIKKEQMTPDMLVSRQQILEDTVDLMGLTSRFNLGISVSDTIYSKYKLKTPS